MSWPALLVIRSNALKRLARFLPTERRPGLAGWSVDSQSLVTLILSLTRKDAQEKSDQRLIIKNNLWYCNRIFAGQKPFASSNKQRQTTVRFAASSVLYSNYLLTELAVCARQKMSIISPSLNQWCTECIKHDKPICSEHNSTDRVCTSNLLDLQAPHVVEYFNDTETVGDILCNLLSVSVSAVNFSRAAPL